MITVHAPGKLFIAGEYAVVEPGQPSVLVAIDRYLTVHLSEGQSAGSIYSPEYGRLPLLWTRDGESLTINLEHHPYDYVMSALTIVERLRAERGVAPRFSELRIDSQLDDPDGRKFGLGSSAAVTVATVSALGRFYDLGLTLREVFQLALLATVQISPSASGGDLAASTFGGWIAYSAPDRALLRKRTGGASIEALLRDEEAWAGFEVRRLDPPAQLRLVVGWTGSPASTVRQVDVVQRHRRDGRVDYEAFLAASRQRVGQLVHGLDHDDTAAALAAIRGARDLLALLGRQAGLAIETTELATLCDIAEQAGAAAKPSGAGGGDCGIVLAPDTVDVEGIIAAWSRHRIRHLPLAAHPPQRDDHSRQADPESAGDER